MGKNFYTSVSGDLVFGASAGIEGIAVLAVAVIGVLGVLRIQIQGDPARRCFLWFHAAILVLTMQVLFLSFIF
jgi:hypothetical protein